MTVKMSSEGDSSKNASAENTEKSETENTDSSQDAKDAKLENPPNDNKKEEDVKDNDVPKESSPEEPDKQTNDKPVVTEKNKDSKNDTKESKPEPKEKEDDESIENDNDSEKDDDDDKEVPLLDQPLEKSGKRERKNVQRFNEDVSSDSKEVTKVEVPNGSGTSLGNIPRIDASISRFKNDDMKIFHRILFKAPGKTTMIKKNIKRFSGFEFGKDSEEYTKKVSVMQKCEMKQLKSICEMLDLQKTGLKDDIIERILEFLLEPRDTGKAVGGGRPKRTAAVRANNRGYSSHDNYSSDERHSGRSVRQKGRRANLKEDSSSASDEDFEPSDEGSDEKPPAKRKRSTRGKSESEEEDDDDVSDVESDSSEESEDQKSKRKKVTRSNNTPKPKGTGKRGRPATKKPVKVAKKKKESSEEDEEEESEHKEEGSSSSEDEPLAKKAKAAQPPTDDEIKTYVKEILEGANLEQITMKTVCQQVYAHYPDFDLAHKKDFIKTTVKSLIST